MLQAARSVPLGPDSTPVQLGPAMMNHLTAFAVDWSRHSGFRYRLNL